MSAAETKRRRRATANAPAVVTRRKAGKALRGYFTRYQVRWIADESPMKLYEKSRRTGITYAESYDATSRRFRPTQPRDMDYFLTSADEEAALGFIDYCRFWARELFGKVADYFTEEVEDPQTRRIGTQYSIRCPNGRYIRALSSNPRRMRSKGGDTCQDESAFHDEEYEMDKAAAPVTTWGGWRRKISTHDGDGTAFFRDVDRCRRVLVQMGIAPDDPIALNDARRRRSFWGDCVRAAERMGLLPVWSYHRTTIHDAIAEGIVEKINQVRAANGMDPLSEEDFLLDCRSKCPDAEAFDEEYLCIPGRRKGALLSRALIESCEDQTCPQPDEALRGYSGGDVYIGVDFGRSRDLTVIWVLEHVGDVLWTRQVRYLQNTPTPTQESALAGIIRSVRLAACGIDMTGPGLGLYEYTRKRFGSNIHGVQFASTVEDVVSAAKDKKRIPVTQSMAVALKGRLEDRTVRLPWNNSRVRDGLHKPKVGYTATGRMTFEAARDKHGHADEFWALAIAVSEATTKRGAKVWFV